MSDLLTLRKNSVDGVLLPADINPAGDTIWTSDVQSHVVSANTYRSMRLTFIFRALVSDPENGIEFNGVLEQEDEPDGEWSPVGYTFNSFTGAKKREDVIVAQPRINWADGGVPNGFFIGSTTVAQISYNPIELPTVWRARIAVHEFTGNDFTRLNCDVYAEMYNPRGS